MKTRLGPLERLFPMPAVLVVGGTAEEPGILAVAWINVVSSTPPTLVMGIRNSRNTWPLIARTGEFTVNVPDTSMAAVVDFCGTTTGRTTDKLASTGLTLEPGAVVATPIIAECPYNLECRIVEETTAGHYLIVIAEIVEAHADERVLREGTNIVEMGALDPLVYCAGVREYWSLGAKVADAYSVGKQIPDVARE